VVNLEIMYFINYIVIKTIKIIKINQKKKISKKDNNIKNKFGLKYEKKFANSCWKFYNLSPITGSKECESLKNIVKYKTD